MFRRMTAKDDAIDPMEQGKKILGGLGIATLIVFIGPLILFPDASPGGAGTGDPASTCPVGTNPLDSTGFRFCIMTASDATACSGVGGIWATIEGNDACRHPDLKKIPAGTGTGTGGGTTTFVSNIKTQVESGVKDVLEMFKWILLAATVGAVVFLRMERAPDGRGELRAN